MFILRVETLETSVRKPAGAKRVAEMGVKNGPVDLVRCTRSVTARTVTSFWVCQFLYDIDIMIMIMIISELTVSGPRDTTQQIVYGRVLHGLS